MTRNAIERDPMFKKLAATLAVSAMLVTATAAQAGPASALSLRNSPAFAASAPARAGTASAQKNHLLPFSPLFAVIGIVAVVGVLEATKVINIFHSKPKSP